VTDTGFERAVALAAGSNHILALKADGTVWAWGSNDRGQLGNGTTSARSYPVQVLGIGNVVSLSAGDLFSLALRADGTVWAWGYAVFGILGTGNPTGGDSYIPIQVTGLSGIVAIAAGHNHALALKGDGTVFAWGRNFEWQLGTTTFPSSVSSVPLKVPGVSSIKEIAAGENHSLALGTDGSILAWGSNGWGQLGIGSMSDYQQTPALVSGLLGVARIAAGEKHTLALKQDGTVWAWGNNADFQLANPDKTTVRRTPIQVPNFTEVASIAGGARHSLAVKPNGTVWTWGYNLAGQLGDGTTVNKSSPVQVVGISSAIVAVGGYHFSGALLSDASLRTWGANGYGMLGNGTLVPSLVPVNVTSLSIVETPTFSRDSGGYFSVVDIQVGCSTLGATIHYTTNGNDPTEADPMINNGGTIRIAESTILKAKAFASGYLSSGVLAKTYIISLFPSPIDNPYSFVRQHYSDFLYRFPDSQGLTFWVYEIADCNYVPSCVDYKRISVSGAFFLSIEFQQTGYLVYRFYEASYPPNLQRPRGFPRRIEFLADTRKIGSGVVVGAPGWETQLEANKVAFANAWVARPEFVAAYPSSMTNAQFVDALNTNTGNSLTSAERDALVDGLANSTETRATVVRKIAENDAFKQKEFNRAFVLMQYVGYLQRNPDDAPDGNFAGYDFWLNKLDTFGGDFIKAEMVKAFITSGEYRHRFGP
jgi:alpha-tubulin suppressor-like RCC1 family protein